MSSTELRLPVSIEVSFSEVVRGIVSIQGTLIEQENGLLFEYRPTGACVTDESPRTLLIPYSDIWDVSLVRRLGGSKLILRPRRLFLLDDMPGANPDEMVYKVKPVDLETAAALKAHVQDRLTPGRPCVPFRLPSIHAGLTEVGGVLYIEDDFLIFEVAYGIPGASSKERRVVKLEMNALHKIALQQGVLNDKLEVHSGNPELLRVMPGSHETMLRLTVPRKHRHRAAALVYDIRKKAPHLAASDT